MASAIINAEPSRVYAILADYKKHHPRIVPPKYFRSIEVLEGGIGDGTRTRIEMRVLGRSRRFEHFITEPERGHIIVESDKDGDSVTSFIVDPVEGGKGTRLTIQTKFKTRNGLLGRVERAMTASMLQRIYAEELGLISQYMREARDAE
ncbi:MAG TPA: SRPBCC family protein [Blastocatellia bacterium]|nr:SRPBCC family protein [Blastocatellia bacterium]